jgi:hypothetical protein
MTALRCTYIIVQLLYECPGWAMTGMMIWGTARGGWRACTRQNLRPNVRCLAVQFWIYDTMIIVIIIVVVVVTIPNPLMAPCLAATSAFHAQTIRPSLRAMVGRLLLQQCGEAEGWR